MLLCLDTGNSDIHGGVFEGEQLRCQFRKSTQPLGSADELGVFFSAVLRENGIDPRAVTQTAVCSVVPAAVHALRNACRNYFRTEPFFLQAGVKTGLKIRYKNPAEVGADRIANLVMAQVSEEGPFALPTKIDPAHGGTGKGNLAWALCDAPVILRALVRMGYGEDSRVLRAIEFLAALVRDNGYPCVVSSSLGQWHGPGRRDDPCPYATLVMLELLLESPDRRVGPEAHRAAECLLHLWERSREVHPYIFWMGDDFRKLKAPLLWYDLVHVLEVLSKAEWLRGDGRLKTMLGVLAAKRGTDGAFAPESAYLRWKDYDFGRKKGPSGYLTAVCLGILARVDLRSPQRA